MELITLHNVIIKEKNRWYQQYKSRIGEDNSPSFLNQLAKYRRINKHTTREEYKEIFGHEAPSVHKCDECNNEEPEAVVMLGEEPDWESNTAYICAKCLLKAMCLIEP